MPVWAHGNGRCGKMSDPNKQTILLLQPGLGYMDSMRTSPSLPLGLLHAASLTVGEFNVVVFDQRISADWRRELADTIKKENPFLIGATMFIGPSVGNALDMLELAGEVCNAPRVAGGVLPSIIPRTCLEDPLGRIDFVIEGEGEKTLSALASRIENGETTEGIPGLWQKAGGRISTGDHAPLLDLETLPDIPYHLLQVERYLPEYGGDITFYMETSRGCPMKCRYCYNANFNRGIWRGQSAARVRERLENIKDKYGANHIYIVDDNFFIDKARGMQISSIFKELDMQWQIQGVDIPSLKKMSDDDLALLRNNGLQRITIGIESGSGRIKKLLGKRYSNEDVIGIIRRLKKFDFIVFCSFMCNIPTETIPEIRQSVSLMLELIDTNPNFRTSPFYRYVPAPGTGLFDLALEQGFRPPTDMDGWSAVSFDDNKTSGISDDRDRFYKCLYVATLLCDSKSREYSSSRLFRFLSALYRPVARLRLKYMFFKLMPETPLFFFLLNRNTGRSG